MYGGSGTTPCRSSSSSSSAPSVVHRRTSRVVSPGPEPPNRTRRSAPAASSVPGATLRLGRTSPPPSPVGSRSSSSTSTAPPVGLVRCSRAGRTRVLLTTTRSAGRTNAGRSATMRCSGGAPGPRSTNNRARSRGSIGVWAIEASGSSYAKSATSMGGGKATGAPGRRSAPEQRGCGARSPAGRRRQAQVLPGGRKRHPTPGGAHEQALLDEERLVDVLHRLGLLPYGGGGGAQSPRAPPQG